jgi:hypothetical protein
MPARAPAIDDDVDAYALATVCHRVPIGKTKLYDEIAAGKLRAHKLRSRTVVLKSDLARWLAGLPALHDDANNRPVASGRRRCADGSPGTAVSKGPIGAGATGAGARRPIRRAASSERDTVTAREITAALAGITAAAGGGRGLLLVLMDGAVAAMVVATGWRQP